MAKKNIYLLLIAAVMSISFILDAKLESSLNSNQFYGYNLATTLVFNFLFFAWCVEHAKYHNVEPPLTLSIILLGPLGILIYFFRRFGFKKGLSNTFKSMGFVLIVASSGVWVAEYLMVKESVQKVEVNKGFEAFDNGDYEAAFNELHDLAVLDSAEAQFMLGWMYSHGKGVDKDLQKAVYWYSKSAEQDHSHAQYNLAEMYIGGEGVQIDYEEAVKWLKRASELGASRAQSKLGTAYQNGFGVNKNYDKAIYWYTKSAEKGYAIAQYDLGILYTFNNDIQHDYKLAIKWYQKAANQGHINAQTNLGWMYHKGNGTDKNNKKAVKWYKKAAEGGDFMAKNNLAVMYLEAEGVKKDIVKAKLLIEEALNGSDIEASKLAKDNWNEYELWKY
jgi:TPR repeat protein